MIEIPLTQGRVALIDDEDYDLVSRYKWRIDKRRGTSYVRANCQLSDGQWTTVLMHRLVLTGEIDGSDIDHVDGDGLNNRRSNLRVASRSQNNRNRTKTKSNTSGYKGVFCDKRDGTWYAKIGHNRSQQYLGRFPLPEDAARAYDARAIELHGEFARPNFPR